MPTYYCYKCVRELGLVPPVNDPTALTASQYQLDKFIKHTAPTGVYTTNSVFLDSSWSTYQHYIVTTASSGSLEIDDQGRKTLFTLLAGTRGCDTTMDYSPRLAAGSCWFAAKILGGSMPSQAISNQSRGSVLSVEKQFRSTPGELGVAPDYLLYGGGSGFLPLSFSGQTRNPNRTWIQY